MPNDIKLVPTMPTHHRFHLLDALRGVASLFVVLWHAPIEPNPLRAGSAFLAVDFFFCLSGFVVAHAYERRLREGLRFHDFFVARLIRLYPMYLLGTLLGLLALVIEHAARARSIAAIFGVSLFMVPDIIGFQRGSFLPQLFPLDGPAWSLLLELIGNAALGWAITRRVASSAVLATVTALSLLALALWLHNGNSLDAGWIDTPTQFFIGLARMFFSFTSGVLLLRIFRSSTNTPWQSMTPAVLVTLALVAILVTPYYPFQTAGPRLFTIAVLFPLTVLLGARVRLPSFFAGPCSALGAISYPLYLFHFPLWSFVHQSSMLSSLKARPSLLHGCVAALTIVFTGLSYCAAKWLDEPIRRTLSKLYATHTAARAACQNITASSHAV